MKIRPILFWSHLAAGVLAGLVILMMSVTGVLLTYERQIIDWAEQSHRSETIPGSDPLSADQLIAIATTAEPDASRVTLNFQDDPDSVIKISADRSRTLLVDPNTGEILHDGETRVEVFFGLVTQVHRWFALSGDGRANGRAVTAYSNLLFLYLLVSGVYLWLPRIWKWAILRTKIFFNPKVKTGKARDFNWHHVFAFWSIIPLFVILTTATVFYFPGVNKFVYSAYGEEAPQRRQRGNTTALTESAESYMTNNELLLRAKSELDDRGVSDWQSISMQTATTPGTPVSFRVDRSIGGQPSSVYNLTLSSVNGSPSEWRTFADNSPASRARSNIRFLHTGEAFGVTGQTIAGLASIAASILVWTGLALAWRRLIQPLIRRRRPGIAVADSA